jgi:hypothetical protein
VVDPKLIDTALLSDEKAADLVAAFIQDAISGVSRKVNELN